MGNYFSCLPSFAYPKKKKKDIDDWQYLFISLFPSFCSNPFKNNPG
jgi:hypothetical protein